MKPKLCFIMSVLLLMMLWLAVPDQPARAQVGPDCAAITTPATLASCITQANTTLATADTLTLAANINLTAALPNITSPIMLNGAGFYVDGGFTGTLGTGVQVFNVTSTGNFTLNNITVQRGNASYGGGVAVNGGVLVVHNSTISASRAANFGGGLYATNSATVTVTGSTISGNTASNGGGISIVGSLTVTNSTISGNTATTAGGGLRMFSGTAWLTQVTFGENSSPTGAGLRNSGTTYLAGVILDNVQADCSNNGTLTANGYNFASDATCALGAGFNNATLALGALSGGGPGQQVYTPNQATSAAVEAIPNATTVNNNGVTLACNQTTTDQLGANRPVNAGADCTSGAVEVAVTPPVPTLSINDVSITEGNAGTKLLTFTITASGTAGSDMTVQVDTANDTATAGSDYVAITGQTATITSGNTTTTVDVTINGDTTPESDESFFVNLSNPTNATIADGQGVGTITNDEASGCAAILNAAILAQCITDANNNGAGLDTLTLAANINLATALPQVTTAITINGAGFYVDGGYTGTPGTGVRVFFVSSSGNLTLNNLTARNGAVTGNGGVIYVSGSGGSLTVNNTTISGGKASSSGGGIYAAGGAVVTITNSTISDNNATSNGGGLTVWASATATITNSAIVNNSTVNGAGILNYLGSLTVTNSTLSGNTASNNGGGLLNTGASATAILTHVTFGQNSAPTGAGFRNAGVLRAAGVILDNVQADCSSTGTFTKNGYNFASDASCAFGAGFDNATLALGALSGSGAGQQAHTPAETSDAVSAIPNGTTVNNNGVTLACNQTTTDQLGNDRPINAGTDCTSGAVEVALTPPGPDCSAITTPADLAQCITHANGAGGADTLTLAGNITLIAPLPTITDETIVNGGNFYVDGNNSFSVFTVAPGGDLTVNNTTIQNAYSASFGSAIMNQGTLAVNDSTFTGNASSGGSIFSDSTMTVTDSTFDNNTATAGAAIFNYGSATITGSTFSDNAVVNSGGAIFHAYGTMTVQTSTFDSNTSNKYGGAIFLNNGILDMINSTVSGNSATFFGGGIMNGGTLHSTYNTLAHNLAPSGGNIANFKEIYMAGTILDALSGVNCQAGMPSTRLLDLGFNMADDVSCGFTGPGSINNANLLLSQLEYGVHTPSAGSDAIGAIPNGTAITTYGVSLRCNGTMTDQLGATRPVTAGNACTSGAVEVGPGIWIAE